MSSSMLAGERRWASARRGGMTVLGKVVVPKPLNLPSQRLENHGLDPNVEIVPKGSLSWGSRSSTSASNPWGSSVVSPNADGSGSPSHLSGRPSSSGGSGTRPSTAGSDRMHEGATSAWGPNSRPSSASGALTSNHTSLASSRPRSAETRPGSSQLSRFAEPVSDNSVAWGSTGTVEKLVLNSKNDSFSLSSGDFPTLGKNPESEDNHSHVRPSSASGRVASPKERALTSQADVKSGNINTWTRDGIHHVEDGVHPSAEKWQGDHQPYLNPNIPPQHFDAWHGPPMNAPAGVWYRGPPGGPPYPPVAHGGYPMDPFPYYRPQMHPPALANPQPIPPRGPGPRGHHPKNGDFYRPQMPDAFIRPGMPIRPGFFPGPVPYDGYYGPPMGYNPNEREIPFMGMPAGPPVFNMYPPQNPSEPGDIHARAGGRSGGKRLVTEHVESGHSDVVRGPYKVLKKRPNEWGLEEEEENLEPIASANAMHVEKVEQQRTTSPNNEWGSDNRRDEEMYSRRATIVENHSSGSLGHQGRSSDPVVVKSPRGKLKAVDDSWGKKSEIAAPSFQEVLPAAPKDTTLMQKIEILNAKVRASDGREVAVREEQKSRVQLVNARTNQSMSEAGSTRVSGDSLSSSQEVGGSTGEITRLTDDNAPAISRRAHHGAHGRVEHNNKGRFNNHDADGWRRKPSSLVSESSGAVPVENVGHTSSSPAHHHHVSEEAAEKSESNVPGKNEGESLTPMLDPTDGQAQRAKMRELAKQRAIQLQKEEEERIKEQRAKALAKLEELNRRTLAGDGSAQKLETPVPGSATQQLDESQKHPDPVIEADQHVGQKMEKPLPSGATQRGPEEFQKHPGSMKDADKHVTLKLEKPLPSGASQLDPKESNKQPTPMMDGDKRVSTSSPRVVAQTSESSISGPGESSVLLKDSHLEAPKNIKHELLVLQSQPLPSKLEIPGESSVLLKDSHLEAPKNIKHELLVLQSQPLPSKLEIVYTGAEDSKAAPSDVSLRRNKRNKQKVSIQVESSVSDKQKQGLQVESTVNDKQKQSIHVESTDKSTSISSDEPLKGHDTGATGIAPSQVDPASAPRLQNNSNIVTESVVHNRRKNSRSSRIKHKLEEAPSSAASQTPVPKENHPTKTSASVASQLPEPNETRPSKTTASTSSQSPVQKESHLANPSSNTASQSLVPKETHVTKISASSTSQSPAPKDTHPAKSSVSGTLQSPVPKEAHPAKTPASAASLSLVSSAKSFASAAAQSLVPKETQPAKVPASASQSAVPKETFPAKGSPSTASQSSVPNETHKGKAHAESGQTKTSQLELDPSPVLLVTDVKEANLSGSEPSSSLPSEEARTRVNNQLKPQNSRRTPRNQQALRSGDKFHGSESVVWAPVRSQQKLEPEGETNQKDALDAIPPTAKSNNPVQSSIKSKRAEMERYVPKPVAKELAQQSVALSSSAQTLDEISEREELGSQSVKPEIGSVGSSLEPRNGNHKHSKQARTQGSWRQRGSSEAQLGEGSQQGSLSTSNPSKNAQRSMDRHDTSKSDSNFVPDDNKATHDWDPSDGWNMPEEPSAAASVTSVVKDDGGGTAKGRRHPHKSHQSTASSHDLDLDHRNRNSGGGGEADKNYSQTPVLDIIQTDRVVSSKESRSSHWQPKSQAYSGNSQRGSTSSGGQTDSSEVEKNSPSRGRVQTQLENKESSDITGHPPHEQSVSENKNAGEATNAVHGEARKERRSASSRRRPRTPNQAAGPPDNMEEQAADQHYSTGFRRGGIRNNQSGRGNESRRDWSAGGQDNRPQHILPSRERQRQNSHFEYQPVGSNSNNGEYNNYDGPVEGSRNVGSRYRERGSGRPRRGAGNFHAQQSGAIRVEAND